MGEKYFNNDNIPDAKTANQISQTYKDAKDTYYVKANLNRWKKQFKKNLDDSMKSGNFTCLVSIPDNFEPIVYNCKDEYLEEEGFGKEIFIEWLESKGYCVEIWNWFFKIGW